MNITIDTKIIESLMSFCNSAFMPGALFRNPNEHSRDMQIDFLSSILTGISAKNIIETGTEAAMFSYLVKCTIPQAKVTTFGMFNPTGDKRELACTDFLNKTFGDYINFIEGDSKSTLSQYQSETPIEFAWIDGGHDRNTLYQDLLNCERLKIPHVCVDDYNLLFEVRNTTNEFLSKSTFYTIQSVTEEERGICYLINRS